MKLIKMLSLFMAFFFFPLDGVEYYTGFWAGSTYVKNKIKELDIDYTIGYSINSASGIKWCQVIRTEIECMYRKNRIENIRLNNIKTDIGGNVTDIAIFANLIYEHPFTFCIHPFVGAGIGWTYQKINLKGLNLSQVEASNRQITGQFIGGISYYLTPSNQISLEYRYWPFDDDLQTHFFGVGFRYRL